MTTLALRGETRRRRERLRTLKDLDAAALVLQQEADLYAASDGGSVDAAALVLQQAVQLVLDDVVLAASLRQQVLGTEGEAQLWAAAEAMQHLVSDEDPAPQVISGSYALVRRFLPALLAGIFLQGTSSAQSLLAA